LDHQIIVIGDHDTNIEQQAMKQAHLKRLEFSILVESGKDEWQPSILGVLTHKQWAEDIPTSA